MQPFLTVEQFEAMIAPRVLTAGERLLVGLLVQATADWIRDPSRLPGLPTTDPLAERAKLVTYDVVRSALSAEGADPLVRQIMAQSDGRTTQVTYAGASALLDFTDRHLEMLGLSTTAAPQARFDSFETAFDDCGPRRW